MPIRVDDVVEWRGDESEVVLPRGVHVERFQFGDTRTVLVVSSKGIVLRRCVVRAELLTEALLDELRAWLDREDPIARKLKLG